MPKTYTRIVRHHEPLSGHSRIVIHTAEGARHVLDLAAFFRRVQADSHMATEPDGRAVRMVRDSEKSWAQSGYNPTSLSIEQCFFASKSTKQWVRDYHKGLLRGAAIVSNWSAKYGIPIRRSVRHGVCSHKDLGAYGGGHVNPGPGFPWRYFLYLAKLHYYRHHRHARHASTRRKLRRMKRYCHAVQRRYAGHVLGTQL